jgi:hypothetical protein
MLERSYLNDRSTIVVSNTLNNNRLDLAEKSSKKKWEPLARIWHF